MKLYRFDAEVGIPIQSFDSRNAVLTRLIRTSEGVQLGCFHLEAGGVIGHHQASCPQLLFVIRGEGWVRGGHGKKVPINALQTAFWETGEWHESGTETGMSALVLEGAGLTPHQFMSLIEGHSLTSDDRDR